MNAGITYLLFQKMSGDLSAPDSVFIMKHDQYMHPKFWERILCLTCFLSLLPYPQHQDSVSSGFFCLLPLSSPTHLLSQLHVLNGSS